MSEICKKGHDTSIVGRSKWGCRMCNREATKRKRLNNIDHYRQREREAYHKNPLYKNRSWAKYGIKKVDGSPFTTVDYDREYQIQQGRCKICGIHQADYKKIFVVEHDHKTSFYRGLVCQGCNIKIGSIESDEFNKVLIYLNLEVH